MADLFALTRDQPLTAEDRGKLTQDVFLHQRKQIANLVSEDTTQALFDFQWQQIFVPLTQNFADRCAAAGGPLSVSEFAAMNRTFSRNAPISSVEVPAPPGKEEEWAQSMAKSAAFHNQQALLDAEKALTPEQFTVFKQMWSEHPHVGPPFTSPGPR